MISETRAVPAPEDNGLIFAARAIDRGDIIYLAYLLLPFRLFLEFGRVLGWLEMVIRPRSRRAVRANLQEAFGQEKSTGELRRLTRRVFEYHQMRTILGQVAPLMTARGQLEKYFPLPDLEPLDTALAQGKGVLLLAAHVNSVGLMLAVIQLRRRGYDARCPMPAQQDAWAPTPFRRFVNRRLGAPPSLVHAMGAFYAQFNVRPLVQVLKEKAVLVLVGDGWHSAGFIDVEFLGRQLPFTSGPLGLARLVGCPVVPIFCVGTPHHLHYEIETPFVVTRGGLEADDLAGRQTHFIHRVEQRMLANIPCWQHWLEPDVFGQLAAWRSQSIGERYNISAPADR